ncbi:MAG: hypothetical protein FWD25_10160 [Clostridia bacterium]|nr:hypothetical protein [Clostridia bacterium]
MDNPQNQPPTQRHSPVQYALIAQPRPGNREIRTRETAGAWLQRNQKGETT